MRTITDTVPLNPPPRARARFHAPHKHARQPCPLNPGALQEAPVVHRRLQSIDTRSSSRQETEPGACWRRPSSRQETEPSTLNLKP